MGTYKLPRGTYDILPRENAVWNYIRDSFCDVAERYGYGQIVTPIFEQADLFERSVGDTSDIVQKEMYKFNDKRGRMFALRPEGTAPVVRSVVQNQLVHPLNPAKLFYYGPMFRYDRPQKGRYRQFYQYGLEYIGSEDPYIDAEVIALAYTFLRELGLKEFTLEINSIGCEDCSKDYEKALSDYFTPHKEELCPDCKIRLDKNPKRLLDCKVPSCKEISKSAPSILDYLDDKCSLHFAQVKRYLTYLEIPFVINPNIVRGLDYYTQTAFEFIDSSLGAQSTLIGGGRYNGLVKQIGGKDYSGIGFAGGFERLILSLEHNNIPHPKTSPPNVFFIVLGEKARFEGIKLIQQLREKRIKCVISQKESIKAQMKEAGKSGAKFALIIGENEVERGTVQLKNMLNSEQTEIKKEDIILNITD